MTKGTTGQERQNSPTHTIQYKKEEEKMSKKIWSRIIVKKRKKEENFNGIILFFYSLLTTKVKTYGKGRGRGSLENRDPRSKIKSPLWLNTA